jgi:hypothetical protein
MPLLCVNDIGSGLVGATHWRHFELDADLSGGFRHPAEVATAGFDLLVRDSGREGAGPVLAQLTVAGSDPLAATRRLALLDARLCKLHDSLRDGQADALREQALMPADFPFSQLSQTELDLILHGATA